jgi:hypothetical protein
MEMSWNSMRSLAVTLNTMNRRFDELQTVLLQELGDEGNDIGDAANLLELIVNTCLYDGQWDWKTWAWLEPHDSYTVEIMRRRISEFYNEEFDDTVELCCAIAKLDMRRYVALLNRIK